MSTTPKIGIFPGTFDPITLGHWDVIERGVQLFDTLYVAIGRNPAKNALFSVSERTAIIKTLIAEHGLDEQVKVSHFDHLTVDHAREVGATAMLRGLRNASDLNYEFQLALTNRAIADIETVFVMSGEQHGFTSSSLIKQIASATEGAERLKNLIPRVAIEAIKQKKTKTTASCRGNRKVEPC